MTVVNPRPRRATFDIERGRRAFEDALLLGDAPAAAALYADDATLLAPGLDVLRGRPAIERFWRSGVDSGVRAVEVVVLDLRQRGEVALEVGEYALHVALEAGGSLVDRGRYLIVHQQGADGHWRRAAEMFSPDDVPSAATGDLERTVRPPRA